jgi:hypothetical protein
MVLLLAGAWLGGTSARAQVLCQREADDVAALRSFHQSIGEYVELHRRLAAPVSSLGICSDPEAIASAADELAAALRAARPVAAAGDVFGPEVADLFRLRLALIRAEAAPPSPEVPPGLLGEEGFCRPLPVVQTRFAWADSSPIGEEAEHVLPTLPRELEYRRVGRALVLLDVPANLVVDVLDEAFPPPVH